MARMFLHTSATAACPTCRTMITAYSAVNDAVVQGEEEAHHKAVQGALLALIHDIIDIPAQRQQ